MIRTALALAVLAACSLAPTARAETVNCTEITSLPATLTSQGVYCLKKDLTTAMASGVAITIATNNVTIDCNGYKVGGLAAGTATLTKGILADNKLNAVVRGCSVRGFRYGIQLTGAGHLIEGNRLDGNTFVGIGVYGDGIVVRGNSVFDTGGPDSPEVYAIAASTGSIDVLDNLISTVGVGATGPAKAISMYAIDGGTVAGNRIRGVDTVATNDLPIHIWSSEVLAVRDNNVFGAGEGWGIYCGSNNGVATGNHVVGFDIGIHWCLDGGANNVVNAP